MPKFKSPIYISGIKQFSANTEDSSLLHLGVDNRVGIGTEKPESELHVLGAITATGLIVPPGTLSDQGDSATAFGFNPNFTDWQSDFVANGYTQTGSGTVERSLDSNLGGTSARFNTTDVVWAREVEFKSPLYANVFFQGGMSYKFESWTEGEPGLAVTLTHRERVNSQIDSTTGRWNSEYSNTFIVPTFPEARTTNKDWQTGTWRATTPGNREITKFKIEIVSRTDSYGGINDGGAGNATSLGGGTTYDWYLDGLNFAFMHPDMRMDQDGRILGSYIKIGEIDDAHIRGNISSTSSEIYSDSGVLTKGLVANSEYAKGWSLSKEGDIKATSLRIYGDDGRILISGGGTNPFDEWDDSDLTSLDPSRASQIDNIGEKFSLTNKTGLFANVGHLAVSGLANGVSDSTQSFYLANAESVTTLSCPQEKGGLLANGTIVFNGVSMNAPPGSVYTGGKDVIQNQELRILFLANTEKWDSDIGASQYHHANVYLGEYGLYVLGRPTVGGWIYHPHGNNTWYSVDAGGLPIGNRIHEDDFLIIGKATTDVSGNITKVDVYPPIHLDEIANPEVTSTGVATGMDTGGVLFADIQMNRYAHRANTGEIQLTNVRNTPNTRFAFIHPLSKETHICNGAYGVLTSLEDFPGSRYITFVGGDKTRFTFYDVNHSPDFVAAFPLQSGSTVKWFYNQNDGKFSEFTPIDEDCVVGRVDSDGSSSKLTNHYRYAAREALTSEGASISDIIPDAPPGMASGGIVFASMTLNEEFEKTPAANVYTSNAGFVTITNDENDPRNEFYVSHPDTDVEFLVANVGRGVVTNINHGIRTGGVDYGHRHIAFVGGDNGTRAHPSHPSSSVRFPMAPGYYNVSNDFIAVTKYQAANGDPHPDSNVTHQIWYYDNGQNNSSTFRVIANDFIIATTSSFDPDNDVGVDEIFRYASREAWITVNGKRYRLGSLYNLIGGQIGDVEEKADQGIGDAADAFAAAADASANADQALGLLDGELAVYFEQEGGEDGIFANNVSTPSRFDYKDLWINVSQYNRFIDQSWSTNAIFLYSNTTGGFDGTLAWKNDRRNPAGRSHVDTLTSRDLADRATVIFYQPRSSELYPFYGPNVAVLATGEGNRIPEGDLWYDQFGSPPTNHAYIYRTNSSFSTSNTSHIGFANGIGTLGVWAQTVHNTGTSGLWNSATAQTGWWDFQDAAAGNASAAIEAETTARNEAAALALIARLEAERIIRESAANALSSAANAQFAADREILAFFKFESDVPTSTGNGDIWIHTDNAVDSTGTKNTGAIFIANTTSGSYPAGGAGGLDPERFWNKSPNSAIGLMYLESYSAGIGGKFERGTNIIPRAYSLWDAPLSDYKIRLAWPVTASDIPEEPYGLAAGLVGELAGGFANLAIERGVSSNSYLGGSSLRLERPAHAERQGFIFVPGTEWNSQSQAENNQKYRIDIPKGKRWIFSYYVRANTTGVELHPWFYSSNSTHYNAGAAGKSTYDGASIYKTVDAVDTWQRHEWVFDFTTGDTDNEGSTGTSPHNEVTSISPVLYPHHASNPMDIYIDAVQMEEVPENVARASSFKEPSDGSAIVFGRKITDGKIVTYYEPQFSVVADTPPFFGPIPNTTPSGLPNPQPHGDFWINTSNNNLIFRYYQKTLSTIPSAQTIYWSSTPTVEDGWYTTEDLRIQTAQTQSLTAISSAASAQAAADREINAFFQTSSPSSTANGDVWIDTDSFATLNTSSIYTYLTVAPGPGWIKSPENAVGISFLQGWLAQEKASRSESFILATTGSGDLNFPVAPEANGIYVGATGNLVFYKNSQTEYQTNVHDEEGYVEVSNRGSIDLIGPNGKIWYPVSGNFGIPSGSIHMSTAYQASVGTTDEAYLMYSNMDVSVRFGVDNFGDHKHIVGVEWDSTNQTWQAVRFNGTKIDFAPDSANGDFVVAKITRPTNVPEGIATLDSWVFKTLPVQVKSIGDGKIVTHYESHSPNAGLEKGKYGPNANVTPTGLANPVPHGDLWVDTSNNNTIYRYHQNKPAREAGAIPSANIVYFSTPIDSSPDGWYSTADPRAQTSFVTAFSAVQDAATAQAAADREINAFFAVETGTPPTATGNGDIWIVTDYAVKPGTTIANTQSIRVANTLNTTIPAGGSPAMGWHIAPNNAMGLTYINMFAKSTGGAFAASSNRFPAGYSTWDAHPSEYNLTHAQYDYTPQWSTEDQDGHTPYPILSLNFANTVVNTTFGRVSPSSLQLTTGDHPNGGEGWVVFANNFGSYSKFSHRRGSPSVTLQFEKEKKWIFSYWAYTNTAAVVSQTSTQVFLYFDDTDDPSSNLVLFSSPNISFKARNTWERQSFVLDFSNTHIHANVSSYTDKWNSWATGIHVPRELGTSYAPDSMVGTKLTGATSHHVRLANLNSMMLRLDVGGGIGATTGNTVWFDGFQWETVGEDRDGPTEFTNPSFTEGAYSTRKITDGKIVNHYGPNYGENPGPYSGPRPDLTPKNFLPNPEPHGDRWVNTSNNRIEFVYNQNASNRTAQTIFWNPGVSFQAGLSDPSGWYSTEDARTANTEAFVQNTHTWLANTDNWAHKLDIGSTAHGVQTANNKLWANFALANAYTADGNALNANAAAYIAQAAADREILAYFKVSTDIPNASGNGDVWIQTDNAIDSDGNKNTGAIFMANTLDTGIEDPSADHWWHQAPENAIGLMYLESYSAGVGGSFYRGPNIVPRALALFDAPDGDYNIDGGGQDSAPYAISANTHARAGISLDIAENANSVIGGTSLKIDLVNASGTERFRQILFSNTESSGGHHSNPTIPTSQTPDLGTFNTYGIQIPKGKRWIYSLYAKSEWGGIANLHLSWITSNGVALGVTNPVTPRSVAFDLVQDHETTDFIRYQTVIDLTDGVDDALYPNKSANNIILGIQPNYSHDAHAAGPAPHQIMIDAIQLEEAVGDIRTASEFSEPSDGAAILFGRKITDGKIVTYFFTDASLAGKGPNPIKTPLGFANPEPHGDLWIDTGNNNVMFRYHQATDTPTSQSAYFGVTSPSVDGWYSLDDPRIANNQIKALEARAEADRAISAAAISQAAADKEILGFFTNHDATVPTATGNGDIWIHTDHATNPLYGTVNTGAIFVSNSVAEAGFSYDDGTFYWKNKPENAMGLSYLESFNAGVSGSYQAGDNIMPRAFSLFDAPRSDYYSYGMQVSKHASGGTDGDLITDDRSGADTADAVAPLDEWDKNINKTYKQLPFPIKSEGQLQIIDTDSYIGEKCLKFSYKNTNGLYFMLGANTGWADYKHTMLGGDNQGGIAIPKGKKWILSFFVKPSSTSHSVQINPLIYFDDGNLADRVAESHARSARRPYLTWNSNKTLSNADWTRYSMVIDLRGSHNFAAYEATAASRPDSEIGNVSGESEMDFDVNEAIGMSVAIAFSAINGAGDYALLDGIQLEEVADDIVSPTPFKEPSEHKLTVFGRGIIDGKIVFRSEEQYGDFGPNPSLTPKDQLPNPEPHGDSWTNLSNNNILFRYTQNSINNTAQTIFYIKNTDPEAPSGWYTTEDPRAQTAFKTSIEAVSAAARSQAAADREINAFFEIHTASPSYTGNGDVWIHIDNVLKPDGTQNTEAIFVWNAGADSGSGEWQQNEKSAIGLGFLKTFTETVGTNWVPRALALFDAPATDYSIRGGHPDGHADHLPSDVALPSGLNDDKSKAYTTDVFPPAGWYHERLPTGGAHNQAAPYAISANNLGVSTNRTGTYSLGIAKNANAVIGGSSLEFKLRNASSSELFRQILFSNTYSRGGSVSWGDTAPPTSQTPDLGTFATYGIQIPKGKRWIYSLYAKSDYPDTASGGGLHLSWITSNGVALGGTDPATPRSAAFEVVPDHTTTDFVRYHTVIDLSDDNADALYPNKSANNIILGLQVRWSGHAQGPYYTGVNWSAAQTGHFANGMSVTGVDKTFPLQVFHIDALQLEEAPGDRVTPSPFQEPSSSSDLDFARAIADGKIITHYENNSGNPNYEGPDPSLTPKDGLPNPTPYGDLWVDTANNNLVFRYYQNTTNYTSKTEYHAPSVPSDYNDESGWYSTEDMRTANAIWASYTAIQRAANSQFAADREIITFFAAEGDNPTTTSGNGDIWIVTTDKAGVDVTTLPSGSANTRSIRVANTLTTGGIGAGENRYWHESPNNAIGLGYLKNYADNKGTRSITDGKIYNHFGPGYLDIGSGKYYGPEPEYSPKNRVANPEPHGDRWVDKSNSNIEYVYHQNGASITTEPEKAYAQTVFFKLDESILFLSDNHPSGWYSTEDGRVDAGRITAESAVAAAATSQAAADREINVFFDIYSDTPTATGNGDIWIQVGNVYTKDFTPNTGAIFVWNKDASDWQQRPLSAVGRGFLETFTSAGVSNKMPSGYSTWDASASEYTMSRNGPGRYNRMPRGLSSFDEPREMYWDYDVYPDGDDPDPIDTVAPGPEWDSGEILANYNQVPYPIKSHTTTTINTTCAYIGANSLQVTQRSGSGEDMYFQLGANTSWANRTYTMRGLENEGGIAIPAGKKWILSWYSRVSDDSGDARKVHAWPYFINATSSDTGRRPSLKSTYVDVTTEWARYQMVIDLRGTHTFEHHASQSDYNPDTGTGADKPNGATIHGATGKDELVNTITGMSIAFRPYASRFSVGEHILFDAIQLEEADPYQNPGDGNSPRPYQEPVASQWAEVPNSVVDGSGAPSTFSSDIPYPLYLTTQGIVNTTFGKVGPGSFQYTSSDTLAHQNTLYEDFFWLAPSHNYVGKQSHMDKQVTFQFEKGKRWIFSYYVYTNAVPSFTTYTQEFLWFNDNDDPYSNIVQAGGTTTFPSNEWTRVSRVLDFSNTHVHANASGYTDKYYDSPGHGIGLSSVATANATGVPADPTVAWNWHEGRLANLNSVSIRLDNNAFQGNTVWYDGFQWEEAPGERMLPAPFSHPDKTAASDYARAIADGKIITHYADNSGSPNYEGPDPSLTPKDGLPNPTPYGDLWVDTANNNLVFRYYQNTTNYTSKTEYHAEAAPSDHNDESGWYSTEDLRTANALSTSYTAIQRAADSQAAADREIITFFASEDDNPTTTSGNGDIWIVTEDKAGVDVSRNPSGSANTKSIRVANTLTTGGIGAGDNRYWHESPNNAIGLGYLKNYADNKGTRAITDGKIYNHFGPGYLDGGSGKYYGPEPEYSPKNRVANPEPHGDRWVDKSNNNVEFVYHQNSASITTDPEKAYAQTVFFKLEEGDIGLSDDDPSGWYSTEDHRVANTENWVGTVEGDLDTTKTSLIGAAGVAAAALSDAANAQASADHEIIVFFESTVNATMIADTGFGGSAKTGPATGNGDIWIQTDFATNQDGTANNKAIFYANLSTDSVGSGVTRISGTGWTQSPDNAIGQGFIQMFADVGVKNWMHSAYSTFDAPADDYELIVNAGGAGGEPRPTGFETIKPYPINAGEDYNECTISIDRTGGDNSYVGSSSLKWEFPAADVSGNDGQFRQLLFSNTNSTHHLPGGGYDVVATPDAETFRKYGIKILPGKKWIYSVWMKHDQPIETFRHNLSYYTYDGTTVRGGDNNFGHASPTQTRAAGHANGYFYLSEFNSTAEDEDWVRVSRVIDTTQYGSENATEIILGIWARRGIYDPPNPRTAWYDAIQLEEAPGARVLPAKFSDPDRSRSLDFARALADGKILTHYEKGNPHAAENYHSIIGGPHDPYYGPKPHETPSGKSNPAPHGDFWVDTANNNAMYRYNQNSSINYAQTAYWSTIAYQDDILEYTPSGWFSVQDGRMGIIAGDVVTAFADIGTAFGKIAAVAATADHELQIFFNDESTADKFVDENTDYADASYGDLWINTSDYNKFANGTLLSNAIFRWQNSLGLSTDTGGGNRLAWRHAPNNAIGKVYLETYAAQNAADLSVMSHYTGNSDGGNVTKGEDAAAINTSRLYGPQANISQSGIHLRNPDGDIWINTANNNEMYVYHVNGGGGDEGYKQRVYWSYPMVEEGWYSSEDLRVGVSKRAAELVAATGGDRMLEVFFAPHHINQDASGNGDIWIHTDNILDENGSANTDAIFVANTNSGISGKEDAGHDHYWHKDPNSSIGRGHLVTLVAETGSNWMPRGFSLFDAPRSSYYSYAIHGRTAGNEHANPAGTSTGTGSTGGDINPDPKYDVVAPFNRSDSFINTDYNQLPYPIKAQGNLTITTSDAYYGDKSLRYESRQENWGYFMLGANTNIGHHGHELLGGENQGGIAIPKGKKWILSWYVKASSSGITHGVQVLFDDGLIVAGKRPIIQRGSVFGTQREAPTADWERFSIVLDLRGTHNFADYDDKVDEKSLVYGDEQGKIEDDDFGADLLDFAVNTARGLGVIFWTNGMQYAAASRDHILIDAVQLEQVTGDRVTPSPFQEPSSSSDIDFSRAMADGKVIEHVSNAFHLATSGPGDHKWGPNPSVTPLGLPNPEPYGDKWVSMSVPYKSYLYFSNNTNKTSQTAYHAPASGSTYADLRWPFNSTGYNDTGWYEVRDTGSALTQPGFQVALGQVAIGGGSWVEGGQVVLDPIPLDPADGNDDTPTVTIGDPEDFGKIRELLLNPVPPSDKSLYGHWRMNSYNVDEAGNRFIPDRSGRGNHALVHAPATTNFSQDSFKEQDPADDVINVSGNHSLYLKGRYELSNPNTTEKPSQLQNLVLGGDAATSYKTYQGSSYPVDISQEIFNKQTLTYWYKPGDFKNGGYFLGRDGTTPGSWNLYYHSHRTGNNDYQIYWNRGLKGNPPGGVLDQDSIGWRGPKDGGEYGPLRFDEWHFVVVQTDYRPTPTYHLYYADGIGDQGDYTDGFEHWVTDRHDSLIVNDGTWTIHEPYDGSGTGTRTSTNIFANNHVDGQSNLHFAITQTHQCDPRHFMRYNNGFGTEAKGAALAGQFYGSENCFVHVRMQSNTAFDGQAGWAGQMSYRRLDLNGDALGGETNKTEIIDEPVWKSDKGEDGYTDIVWDMTNVSDWTDSIIYWMRFDFFSGFAEGTVGHYNIREIVIGNTDPRTSENMGKQSLWIYREGEGLLYYDTQDIWGDTSNAKRPLFLNGTPNSEGDTGSRNNVNGYYDEVRLYNSILTPRNIRYLYMNPTGRPHLLPPRPGMGVKKNYLAFDNGAWADGSLVDERYANSFAYFHGFDVDGNPADIKPYISIDGNVKYLEKGPVKVRFGRADFGTKVAGNTCYIMYSNTKWDDAASDSIPTGVDSNYVMCRPVGSNTTQVHTWRHHVYHSAAYPNGGIGDNPRDGWKFFTPDDEKNFIVGEMKLASVIEMAAMSAGTTHTDLRITSIQAYEMARQPSTVRESYNFTISPSDFLDGPLGEGGGTDNFFANTKFWTEKKLHGTYIEDASIGSGQIRELAAGKIEAGQIEAKVTVGGEAKIIIDGSTNRIIIRD